MSDSFHPIFVLMNWMETIIYLLWLAIHICFSYEFASMIRILRTPTFYQLSEQQWLKALFIWVCLCMLWMSEFWLSHPTWSILPIIKKILKLPGIFKLQPRRVSWRANKLVPLPRSGDWSSASLGDDIVPALMIDKA